MTIFAEGKAKTKQKNQGRIKEGGLTQKGIDKHTPKLTSSAPFNAKGRSLRGLTDASESLFVQVRAERLAQANSSCTFAFPEGGGCDARHYDVLAVRLVSEALLGIQFNLGLIRAESIVFIRLETGNLGHSAYREGPHLLTSRKRGRRVKRCEFCWM